MIYTNINGTVVPTKAMYSTDSTGAQKPIRSLYWGANQIYPDGLGWWNWCNQEWRPYTQYMSTTLATISAGQYMVTPTLSNFPNYILTGYRSGIQSTGSAHWYNNTGTSQVVRLHIAFEAWSTSSDSRYRSIQITTTPAASYSSATLQGTFAFYLNGTSATDYTMHSYSSGWITVPAGYRLWEMAMPYQETNNIGLFCTYDRLRNIVVQIESQTW